MTIHQQKQLLANTNYFFFSNGRKLYGRQVGFAEDHRGFGAVVKTPDGAKSFWVLNRHTMKIEFVGAPPPPTRRSQQAHSVVLRLR